MSKENFHKYFILKLLVTIIFKNKQEYFSNLSQSKYFSKYSLKMYEKKQIFKNINKIF